MGVVPRGQGEDRMALPPGVAGARARPRLSFGPAWSRLQKAIRGRSLGPRSLAEPDAVSSRRASGSARGAEGPNPTETNEMGQDLNKDPRRPEGQSGNSRLRGGASEENPEDHRDPRQPGQPSTRFHGSTAANPTLVGHPVGPVVNHPRGTTRNDRARRRQPSRRPTRGRSTAIWRRRSCPLNPVSRARKRARRQPGPRGRARKGHLPPCPRCTFRVAPRLQR
jgi:hypothetical protein